MPIKKVFVDYDGNEMQCYENAEGYFYFEIKNESHPDHPSYILLEREDVEELILLLTDVLNPNRP